MLKYKLKIPTSTGVTDTHLNIPIVMENQMVDQSEIIERKFVNTEVEKSINPIVDYEKSKLKPYYGNSPITSVSYNVTMIDGDNYEVIGFNDGDLENRSNAFRNSFLRLSFYDSDRLSSQTLISFITLFSTVYETDIVSGKISPASQKGLIFKTVSEKISSQDPSEGFNIFHFKDEVILDNPPKVLYMKAEFNNAKNGKTTNLMTNPNSVSIDNLVNQLHTKYLLQRDTTRGYFYEIDTTGGNVTLGTNTYVDLYEINAL